LISAAGDGILERDNRDALATHGWEIRDVSQDINVLALVKGGERYIFLFDDDNRSEALRTLGRYASNPDLSFSWYDAAVLSQKIRQTAEHEEEPDLRFTLPLPSDQDEM
jgi:hypothetical protein